MKVRGFSSVVRREFTGGRIYFNKPAQTEPQISSNVTGLSANVVANPSGPVGPGASKDSPDYKNPEYFCYNRMSYHEAEIEMLKYRCPQPDNKKPYKQ